MKKYSVLIIIMLLALMSGSGCYTVLQHTNDEQAAKDYGDNYNEDYGYSQYYYPSYWTLSPRWGRYYAVPWWWDYGYYHDNEPIFNSGDEESPRSSGGEKAVPESRFRDTTPNGVPVISRGTSSSGSSGSSAPVTPSSATKQKTEEKASGTDATETRTKENKEETKESKPTREAGRWHKK